MSGLYVKICGLTSEEAVEAAIGAGADAVGFVFAPSARRLTPRRAAELARLVPRHVEVVAVTRQPSQAEVDEIASLVRPHRLQAEVLCLPALKLPRGMASLAVLRSGGARPPLLPPLYLYEGQTSGSGLTADWTEARALARQGGLILAGGLNPDNVAVAVGLVRPFGVDVSSGVEAAPGVKDPARVEAFVLRAREAARSLSGAHP